MVDEPIDISESPADGQWARRIGDIAAAEVSGRRAALHRLADATRRVIHATSTTELDEASLHTAAEAVEAAALLFEETGRRSIYEGFGESAPSGDTGGFFDHSPLLGRANPMAPPIELILLDDSVMEGRATFGAAFEGPPGCVHGGFVAAGFDEVLGAAQSLGGNPGMTGRLSITYRSPTPLHTEVVFTGRLERVDGRKTFTTGTLHAGDRLCAEAEGLFISIDSNRFAELRAQREEQISQLPQDE